MVYMKPKCFICNSEMDHGYDDLWYCPKCDLMVSDQMPELSIYDMEYAQKYFRYSHTELGEKINRARWDLVLAYGVSGTILDYGCGTGQFRKMNPNGAISVEGYDINPHCGFFKPRVLPQRYDAITLWDVLEHLENPMELVKSFNSELLFLTTPNASFVPDIPNWKHYYPHEHVIYFTVDSIMAMFDALKYSILEINYMEGEIRSPEHPEWLMTVVARKH